MRDTLLPAIAKFPPAMRFAAVMALVVVALIAAFMYVDNLASLAIVRPSLSDGLAATDAQALHAAMHLDEDGPTIADLTTAGRLFRINDGTRCRVMQRNWRETCEGNDHPFLVRLLDPPRNGQLVWMCSDSVRMTMAWP